MIKLDAFDRESWDERCFVMQSSFRGIAFVETNGINGRRYALGLKREAWIIRWSCKTRKRKFDRSERAILILAY